MIKEYVGTMYREGCRDEAHEVEVNHGDGYLHGVCDICGEPVEHFDVGELVVEKCDESEIEDAAIYQDWVVMGKHLICPSCKDKIAAIKGDIKVVDNKKVRRNCDVGTLDEQLKRFSAFCMSRKCNECPFVSSTYGECGVRWSQMPYEGGEK